jgi:hypothetical protein
VGDEAGPQHLPLGELAQPDRVQRVGLGTPGEVLDVTGIDQPGLEPVGFQQGVAPFQESLVASMTTRVTPSSPSRSAMTSSQRVIVWSVVTSGNHRPELPWPRTRTQQVSSALPDVQRRHPPGGRDTV